jgi:DNA-binding SARP family transcriptional activator/tetratricopeptide (TPR) repeat protein
MRTGVDIRFQVLGPWEVTDAGVPVVIPAGRMRVLLASLMVSVGRSVPTDTLAEQVWPERMPARVRATVHTYVARLRRLLGHEVIQTAPGGYQLAVPPDRIDLWAFRELLREAGAAGSPEEELCLLRQALTLWRGRPFASMESTWLDREVVPRLGDEWFSATERRIDLEMREDNPGNLIAELRDLVRAYPTRESLWLRLIDALHRCGRRAEALDAYQEVRGVLTDELGIEPGDALQQTHRGVLLDGATPSPVEPAPESVATRQLPHDIANFSCRAELAQLHRLMTMIAGNERRVTHIVAIDGAPGIGKTTLAVHWAHLVARAYPDLQLYLNLRGYGPREPMTPSVAAETLLRGLGVHSDMIPPGADERTALLRSTLAGRRVLLLLDNARDAEQVRPLVPAADSLVVVTSRNQLRGLSIKDGAHRVTLGPLPPHEALALLAAAFGPARLAAERDAATRLVELCDGLPLALAIVAERAQRAGGLTEVVQALMDERIRLDVFGDGEGDPHTDLWVALTWSYRALGPDAAAMFRRLGLHPADDVSPEAAAALAGVPLRRAKHALDQLAAAHLLQQRRPYRYELHDLVRWYAREQAERDETPQERRRAERRVVDWYLHAAVAADSAMHPHRRRDYLPPYQAEVEPPEFADAAAGMAWFEREYDNLRSVIRWADASGFSGHAWRTVTSMTTFFERRIPWQDAVEFHEWALGAASAAGERTGEAFVLNGLGYMCALKGDLDTAIRHFRGALDRFRSSGHVRGEAMLWGNLSTMYGERGDHQTARRYASRALEMCESLGYERGCAFNLDNLGVALYAAGRYDAAIECHLEAGEINSKLGETNSEAMNRHHLGRAYAAQGQPRPALRAFRAAIAMYRGLTNRRFEALVMVDVGATLHEAGHGGLARSFWESALATLKEYDDPAAQRVHKAIGGLHTAAA